MKFAIRIPSDIFSDKKSETSVKILQSFGGEEALIDFCKENLDGVEIAMVGINMDAQYLMEAVKRFVDRGLNVTIHGKLNEAKNAEEFFAPYTVLLREKLLELINITVHPLMTAKETEDILSDICKHIEENNYPVRITLENQRNKSETTAYAGCRGVCDIVSGINNPNLYLCFDFGHQLSNVRKGMEPFDEVSEKFFSLVRHTHIHSYYDGITHFPLNCGETLLDENITGLMEKGYNDTYLLELDPKRYSDKFDIKKSAYESVKILKAAVYQCECKIKAKEDYKNYAFHIGKVKENMSKSECGLGVVGPSAYILKMGDTKIAIDPCLSLFDVDENGRTALKDVINECSAVVVTHAHRDHFDPELLDELSSGVKVYYADFIDYKRENSYSVKDGDKIHINDVELTFFESAHTLGNNVVPEYGFCVTYQNENYVFPTDVRDYGKAHPVFENTKSVIAHLWLGKQNALNLYDNKYIEPFCSFVKSFKAEKVYLSHMYDIHRKIDDMWTDLHYNLLKDKFDNSLVIKLGDWIEF